eukprot:TRINITY_DN21639_c1_g1_i1.p2 TRINITY_DN21639_c1_g1~~TRINITY_DN21639_c1_g1_i1.p2  ORF type:complete len:182 (-),score=31.72 TRINITY_DN21639_c1_g1_i1:127-672(-)
MYDHRKRHNSTKANMPLPKYYCDFCDRTFNDSTTTRKKHFSSKYHQSQVKYHYDSYRDPNNPYPELVYEAPVCPSLVRTGRCDWPETCRFYHHTSLPPFEPVPKVDDPFATLLPTTSSTLAKQGVSLPIHLRKYMEEASTHANSGTRMVPTPTLPDSIPPSVLAPPPGGWVVDPTQLGSWG